MILHVKNPNGPFPIRKTIKGIAHLLYQSITMSHTCYLKEEKNHQHKAEWSYLESTRCSTTKDNATLAQSARIPDWGGPNIRKDGQRSSETFEIRGDQKFKDRTS